MPDAEPAIIAKQLSGLVGWRSPADAAFIAAAREDIPFLLDQLAAAEAKIAKAPHGYRCYAIQFADRSWRECICWKSDSPVSALDAVRADAWDEGVRAQNNSSSLFEADTLARNPYRAAQTGATE